VSYNHLNYAIAGRRATIALDRPEVRNALHEDLIAELTHAVGHASMDPDVRTVVIAGEGTAFCAGADLDWMRRAAGWTRDENLADAAKLEAMFRSIYECPKVTIARVHGAAIGGGVGLAAVCDAAIASESAVFSLSEVRLGLVPAIVGPYVLEKTGMGAARALFVTGERIGAREALRIGLVNNVVPPGDLDAAVDRLCASAEEGKPNAVAAAKRLLMDLRGVRPEDAAAITVPCIADLRAGPEAQAAIAEFLASRSAPPPTASPSPTEPPA
jgi:methylglutaconyl-CoA hydratase